MNDVCGYNRFEIIEKYKQKLIESTNIESSKEEMAVIDDILFRFWQMGWLEHDNKLRTIETDTAYECGKHSNKWIPVSERLPKPQEDGDKDYSDWVQITLHKGFGKSDDVVGRAYYCFSEKKWYSDRLGIGTVTAWMPLPKPYEVEMKSEE